jgi:hypothetical protein
MRHSSIIVSCRFTGIIEIHCGIIQNPDDGQTANRRQTGLNKISYVMAANYPIRKKQWCQSLIIQEQILH